MPSPFPGMNPYLERDSVWHDFHQAYVPALRESLAEKVRPKYLVTIDDHVFLHELPHGERHFIGRPDVGIVAADRETSPGGTAVATSAPPIEALLPHVEFDEERLSFLEVRDRESRLLVTVIEVVSPTNKRPGSGREQYVAKRGLLLAAGVNFVEIDLLRGGPRLPLDRLPPCDYYAMVSRPQRLPRVEAWPIGLRDPLPAIPIPLRSPDPDAPLDLQAALHRVYDAACYEDYVYRDPIDPPLSAADAEWAQAIRDDRDVEDRSLKGSALESRLQAVCSSIDRRSFVPSSAAERTG